MLFRNEEYEYSEEEDDVWEEKWNRDAALRYLENHAAFGACSHFISYEEANMDGVVDESKGWCFTCNHFIHFRSFESSQKKALEFFADCHTVKPITRPPLAYAKLGAVANDPDYDEEQTHKTFVILN